jgi:hypothetical protein
MAKKKPKSKVLRVIRWTGSNYSYWSISSIPISKSRIRERKTNPHKFFHDLEYEIELDIPMNDTIKIKMSEQELVSLIVNAELILKRRSLPQ